MELTLQNDPYAVVVQNAYKKYGNGPYILKNLSMNIPRNQIYGLLGSSGCGKTTLLKTLIGAIDLDYGKIRLNTEKKKELGFMPQETALFDEFTVAETLKFYANLYRIPEDNFKAKVKELKDILDLPRDDQLCSTLSGGQIRRVSIAVTILHSPVLVVLDEPTSGLDPLLANIFWRYLQDLAKQGQTIIITTHYIEEARQANIVGLMRHGVILAEDAPESLISHYKVDNLEDVFLRLCERQNEGLEVEQETKIPFEGVFKNESQENSMFWPHVIAVMYRNFKWAQRSWLVFLCLTYIISAFIMFECNEILRNFPDLNIGVINRSPVGCANFSYEAFNCTEDLDVDLSCQFIDMWEQQKPDMPMIHYDDLSSAMIDGKKRTLVTVLDIPTNFSVGILRRFEGGWNNTDDDLIDTSAIDVRLDTTDYMAVYKVEQSLKDVLHSLFAKVLSDCDYSPKVANLPPISINMQKFLGEGIIQNIDDYTVHVALSCTCGVTYLGPLILMSISLCFDKISGTYTRSIVGGVKVGEILWAAAFCLMIFNFTNIAVMNFIQFVLYGKPSGNYLLFYALVNYLGIAGTAWGLLTILLTNNVMICAGVAIAGSVVMYVFTGFMYPIEASSLPFLRYISAVIFPHTLVLKSLLAIVWKDASFFHQQVLYGFGICTAHIIFYGLLVYLVVKIRKTL